MVESNSLNSDYTVRVGYLFRLQLVVVFPRSHKIFKEKVTGDADFRPRRKCLFVGNGFFHVYCLIAMVA